METVIRRSIVTAGTGVLLATSVGSCGYDGSTPAPAVRIDYVAGATEPLLTRGERIVIEGLGFGTTRGSVTFMRINGGTVEASVADSDWTPFTITADVPDSAATGKEVLAIVTATGATLSATVHVLARPAFNPATLTWVTRGVYPGAVAGLALAGAEFPAASGIMNVTLYAAGGAEPGPGGLMAPDSSVYITFATPGGAGAIRSWRSQPALPARRAFAAAAVATRFNSRIAGSAFYVIGGSDATGRAQASVLGADVTVDSVTGQFVFLEPLPAPRAGAIAVVRHGRIYVIGGTDTAGVPQSTVYVGRVGADGHIDGWFSQPPLVGPRAYGAGITRYGRVTVIGGVADTVPPGGGANLGTQRLVTGDTAPVSLLSGFFTGGWGAGPALLPEGRSQFALLDLDSLVLAVGGVYAGAATNAAETLVTSVVGDSVSPFTGPVGTNRVADLSCLTETAGTLIGLAGVTWRELDGTPRGLVVGGVDLATQTRRTCTWGF